MSELEVEVGAVADMEDPGCREFAIGDGDWPFRGFVVRRGDEVFAYQNLQNSPISCSLKEVEKKYKIGT